MRNCVFIARTNVKCAGEIALRTGSIHIRGGAVTGSKRLGKRVTARFPACAFCPGITFSRQKFIDLFARFLPLRLRDIQGFSGS